MLDHDLQTRHLLAREHQARLEQDARSVSRVRPDAVETRARRRLRVRRSWIRLHPAGDLS